MTKSNKKIVVLLPYCPYPADTGGKAEMLKHLNVLRELGQCTVLSAEKRPVGAGWDKGTIKQLQDIGIEVVLRDTAINPLQMLGWLYAAVCKGLGLEKAFGHSNPYHRYAYPKAWWGRHIEGADLVVVNYSYWSWLPSTCPKACVLLDLWSQYMWEGAGRERRDLSSCDKVFVISKKEQALLESMNVSNTFWSPPAIEPQEFPLSEIPGLVGSNSRFNQEGIDWLLSSNSDSPRINVYGKLADYASEPLFNCIGSYSDNDQPYRDCGIMLFTTVQGMGVQIKTIEALAAGRAIIARRGAVRGLPEENTGWLEVDTPEEMLEEIRRLQSDPEARNKLASSARAYYNRQLRADTILETLRGEYRKLLSQ